MASVMRFRTPIKQPLFRELEHILCTNRTILSDWSGLSCVALKKDNDRCTRKTKLLEHAYKTQILMEEIKNAGEAWEADLWVKDIEFIVPKVVCWQHKSEALARLKKWKVEHGISEDHESDNDTRQADCEVGGTLTKDTSPDETNEHAQTSDDARADTTDKHNEQVSLVNDKSPEVVHLPKQIDVPEGNEALQDKPSSDPVGISDDARHSHSAVSRASFSEAETVYDSGHELPRDGSLFGGHPGYQSESMLSSIEIDDDGSLNGTNYVLSNRGISRPTATTSATSSSDTGPQAFQLPMRGLPESTSEYSLSPHGPNPQSEDREARLHRLKQTMTGPNAARYEAITAGATPRDLEEGVLYICKREVAFNPSLYYVGFSSGDPIADVANSCYGTTSSLEWQSQRSFKGAWRAKKIALASLGAHCQPDTMSDTHCSSTETCKLNHHDWYQVDRGQIDSAVYSWAHFVGLAYDAEGHLTDGGIAVMEILCESAHPETGGPSMMSAEVGDGVQTTMTFEDLLPKLTAHDVRVATQGGDRGVRERAKAVCRKVLGLRPESGHRRSWSSSDQDHGGYRFGRRWSAPRPGRTSREATICGDDRSWQPPNRSLYSRFRSKSSLRET